MHRVREAQITPELLREWAGHDQEFSAANLRGGPHPCTTAGELDTEARATYLQDLRRRRIGYVIVSCGTPIAWRTGSRWQIISVFLSTSIRRHQVLVCAAFGCTGVVARQPKQKAGTP